MLYRDRKDTSGLIIWAKKRLQEQINEYKANRNKPLVVSNIKKLTKSQESGKKKRKKESSPIN